MRRTRILWLILPALFLTALISIVAISWLYSRSIHNERLLRTSDDLQNHAQFLSDPIIEMVADTDFAKLDSVCTTLSERIGARITVVLSDGRIVADSYLASDITIVTPDQIEVTEALSGAPSHHVRRSPVINRDMLFVAIPLSLRDESIGALRLAVPVNEITNGESSEGQTIFLVTALILLLTVLLGVLISRRIASPIQTLTADVYKLGKRSEPEKVYVNGSAEIESLADSINDYATRMRDQIAGVTRQRNERDAILSSMSEGVIAIDKRLRILSMNATAQKWFGRHTRDVVGHDLQEVVRNNEFIGVVREALEKQEPMVREFIMYGAEERVMKIHGALLQGDSGVIEGAVFLLDDVTRMKRLERMRSEFVANVSHELKTPITSIKGFVETLLGSAGNDPEERKRFLQIVLRQSDRLNAIIDDLLTLSRLEHDDGAGSLRQENVKIANIVGSAALVCKDKAQRRNITIQTITDKELTLTVDPQLIEQALLNLIDNAVKYSPDGEAVQVIAQRQGDSAVISVIDNGPGIDRSHISRIFERFYRVDRARSREVGGTGLGLSIVKHIVNLHGGRVEVESSPGKGSCFSIFLPL